MCKKVLIAMSGGVDSSVAAFLMKEKGYDCVGATMKLFQTKDICINDAHSCCTEDDIADAKAIADRLNMPHHVLNYTGRFKEFVVDKFVKCYENGLTPNPCVDCNRYMKFEKLFAEAANLGCDYIVTGHYARIEYDEKYKRNVLKKAIDPSKDQSYVLYSLNNDQLNHTIFPLGSMPKADTLARIADALDLSVDYLLGRSLAARPAPVASPALAEMLDIFPQLSDSAQEMLLDVARAALAREQKNAALG